MTRQPTLFWTIVRNDLRLWWRGPAGRKASWATGIIGWLLFFVLAHLMAWGALAPYAHTGRGGPMLVCLLTASMLAMTALHRSLEVLYNRADLSLLLSSPVPASTVLLTRLVDITMTTLLGTTMLVLPVTDVAIALFGWQWIWAFPTWFAASLIFVPLGVLTTIVAVERIGARRARTALQLAGMAFGLAAVVVTQVPNWQRASAPRGTSSPPPADPFAWLDVPPLQQLVAAASGAWQWLLPLVTLAAGLFALARHSLATRFVGSAQGAAADTGGERQRPADAGAAWRGAFRRSSGRTLVRTQFLLLRRDPLLVMRCAMQVVSFAPMFVGAFLFRAAVGIGGVAMTAAAVIPLHLAALRNANDDGHDFESASPITQRGRARVRSIAFALPLAVLALAAAAFVAANGDALLGALIGVAGITNAFAGSWLGTCTVPVLTAEERARGRPTRLMLQLLFAFLFAGLGTGGLGAVAAGRTLIGAILFTTALLVAAATFLLEPRAFARER